MVDAAKKTGRRRWIKWSAIALGGTVLALIGLVALLPWALSGQMGKSLLVDALQGHVAGKVTLADLSLSWSGPQTIRGLSITSEHGSAITLDIAADNSLLAIVRLSEPPRVTIGGSLATKYRADGTLELSELWEKPVTPNKAPDAPSVSGAASAAPSRGTPLLETLSGMSLRLNDLSLKAQAAVGTGSIEITGVSGSLSVIDAGIHADITASTKVDEKSGSLKFKGVVSRLFTPDGAASLEGAAIQVDLEATALAIPAQGVPLEVDSLSLHIASEKVASAIAIDGRVSIRLPTGESANATIDIDARDALDPQQRSLEGAVAIDNLPTTAVAPYLPAALDSARDLGPTVGVKLTLSGRNGSLDVSSEHLALHAAGSLTEKGDLLAVDSLDANVMVAPALLPSPFSSPARLGVRIVGNEIEVPLPMKATPLAWNRARGSLAVSLDPLSITLAATESTPARKSQLGATKIGVSSQDLTAGAAVTLVSTIDGAALSINQQITQVVGAKGFSLDAARAKGTVELAGIVLAGSPWIDEPTRETLALLSATQLGLQLNTDATIAAGSTQAQISLGSTAVDFAGKWSADGCSIENLNTTLQVDPKLVAHFAHDSLVITSPCTVELKVPQASLQWPSANGNQQLSVDATITATISQAGAQAARVSAAFKSTDLKSDLFDSSVDVEIAAGNTLSKLVDAGDATVALIGPGAIKGSFARQAKIDAVSADITLPRLKCKGGAAIARAAAKGSPMSIDITPSQGSFDIPAEIVEAALGLRSKVDWKPLMEAQGGRAIRGSFKIDKCRWTGSAADTSVVLGLAVEPGSLLPSDKPEIKFDTISMSINSPRLSDRAQANLSGRFKVGDASVGDLALALDASGDLRALLGEHQFPLALKASRLDLKLPGALGIAVADWCAGGDEWSRSAGKIGDVDASLNIIALQLPGDGKPGTADVRVDIAPLWIQPTSRPKLSLGKSSIVLKSSGFDRECIASLNAPVQVGDAPSQALALAVNANGDLRSLLGAPTVPLSLTGSEVTWKSPGSLALAIVDWSRGGDSASGAISKLGPIDARATIKQFTLPPGPVAGAAFDLALDIAPIEVQPVGEPALSLNATKLTASTGKLAQSLDISLTGGSSGGGSVSLAASATGLADSQGKLNFAAAGWTAQMRANKVRTALFDALLGQGNQLVAALGPQVDASIDAVSTTSPNAAITTDVRASVATQYLQIDAPRVRMSSGRANIAIDQPLHLTFTINNVLKKRLLEPLNPVLADIRTAPPIKLTVSNASYPLDGNLRTLELDARIDVGDVEVVRSNQVLGILALAQNAKSETIPARIEPLVIAVRQGKLKYSDFTVKAGRFGEQWQQKLVLSGDIDLGRTPPFANAITCRYPISSLGRTIGGVSGPLSSTLQEISTAIAALPIDPGELLQVDVTLSGPLQGSDGAEVPLQSKVKLVFDASSIDSKDVGKTIKDVGKTIDGFRKLFGK